MRYDFAKQRYIVLMPILVAALGLIPFAIDKLNILPVLKTSAMTPSFRGLVAIIIGSFVALFSFFKPKSIVVMGVFLVAVAVVVVFGLIFVESVAVIIIASFFYLYVVFVYLALHTTYGCLLDLEKYFECQAETKDCDIRLLQSNTDREGIEEKRQECENNEKKARENYEEGKGKLSYCLLIVMTSVMLCVVFSVIDNPNVWGHKVAKKMTNDQNSNMECLGLTIENPKPKDSKDDTKK
ncbi:hypothetical protein KVE05_00945 [Helicobacter pylori]|nr:hypothetical protein KVE05_00945 [Helicobacter pylori]